MKLFSYVFSCIEIVLRVFFVSLLFSLLDECGFLIVKLFVEKNWTEKNETRSIFKKLIL